MMITKHSNGTTVTFKAIFAIPRRWTSRFCRCGGDVWADDDGKDASETPKWWRDDEEEKKNLCSWSPSLARPQPMAGELQQLNPSSSPATSSSSHPNIIILCASQVVRSHWDDLEFLKWHDEMTELSCCVQLQTLYYTDSLGCFFFCCALPSLQFYMSSLPCPTSRRRRRSSPASNHINYIEREIESEDFEFAAWKICKMISSRLFLLFFTAAAAALDIQLCQLFPFDVNLLAGGTHKEDGQRGKWRKCRRQTATLFSSTSFITFPRADSSLPVFLLHPPPSRAFAINKLAR